MTKGLELMREQRGSSLISHVASALMTGPLFVNKNEKLSVDKKNEKLGVKCQNKIGFFEILSSHFTNSG